MSSTAEPQGHRGPPPLPGVSGLVDALKFVRHGSAPIGAWSVYLPALGLAFGFVWVAADRAVAGVAGRLSGSVAVLVAAVLLTRARPLLALGRVLAAPLGGRAQGLIAVGTRRDALEYAGTAAAAAVELALLSALDRYRVVGLTFAPMLGCCSIVVLAVGSRAARTDGRRLKLAPDVTFREFGVATAATFAVLFWATEFLGLLLVLTTALCTIAARVGWHRWLDGINETALLATSEAVQCAVLALLVALS